MGGSIQMNISTEQPVLVIPAGKWEVVMPERKIYRNHKRSFQ